MTNNVFVVVYQTNLSEQFAIKGVFTDINKATNLRDELQPNASDYGEYDIEEWELNMTQLESSVRGMIRNLKKGIINLQSELDRSAKELSYGAIQRLEDKIEEKQNLVKRLQAALCNELDNL